MQPRKAMAYGAFFGAATILWLVALRREGQVVSAWAFLKLGSVVMPLALIASLASFIWRHGVVPTAVRSGECVRLCGSPAAAPVGVHRVRTAENRVDHGPSGLHRILASKEGSIARHGIA